MAKCKYCDQEVGLLHSEFMCSIESVIKKNEKETEEANIKLSDGLQKCPYCNGTSGLIQHSTVKVTKVYNWKGDTTAKDKIEYPKPANCINCGKHFKIKT